MPVDSGLEDHFSDIVAKLEVSPGDYMNLLYRTQINKNDFTFRRNELKLGLGVPALRLTANYTYFDYNREDEFIGREQISYSLSSQFNRNWRGRVEGVSDLTGEGNLRNLGLNLTYEDECLLFSTDLSRSFYSDRELKPSTSIMFRINFKTLGGIGSGATSSK